LVGSTVRFFREDVVLSLFLATTLIASDGLAGQTPSPAEESIVVTGSRLSPEEAQRVASQFLRAAGVGTDDRPVARWEEPVCISIQGLRDEYAAILRRRMEQVARAVGVRLAPSGCDSNIGIIFTTDPLQSVRNIETRRPGYLRELSGSERERVFRPGAPVRWLYGTTTTTIEGREMTDGAQMANPAVLGVDQRQLGAAGSAPMTFGYGASSVSSGVARVLRGVAVVVDLNALDGQTMGALGDYLAMVSFAEMRSREAMPAGSVLNLFTPAPPAGLTHQDRAFLSTLYRLPLDRRGRRHRAIMMRELVAAMTATGAVQR
jgi:hypothetical protein